VRLNAAWSMVEIGVEVEAGVVVEADGEEVEEEEEDVVVVVVYVLSRVTTESEAVETSAAGG
jgi:hypothetical protein